MNEELTIIGQQWMYVSTSFCFIMSKDTRLVMDFFCYVQYIQVRMQMGRHKTMLLEPTPRGQQQHSDVLQKKMQQGVQQAQLLRAELKHTIRGLCMMLFRVEAFYLLYGFYVFSTVCETIVLFAWDLLASSFNILLPLFQAPKIKRTSFFACIVMAGYWLIIQDLEWFDVSALYHFFRGQNTVKLYSVGLSITIFEIMLTTTGKTYLVKLPKIFLNSQTKPREIFIELVLAFLYSIVHFFVLYIDFVLFVIILNSTASNRFLYLFTIGIGKLKMAVFKKFDRKTFRNELLFDAKDRFHKLTFCVIFMLTMEQRMNYHLYLTILKALAFGAAIDYLRNLTYLAIGGQLNEIKDFRNKYFQELYLKPATLSRHQSVMKCLEMDFTVIPYILFLFKFAYIIFKQIKKMDFNLIATYIFAILVVYTLIVKITLQVFRRYKEKQKRLEGKGEDVRMEI